VQTKGISIYTNVEINENLS